MVTAFGDHHPAMLDCEGLLQAAAAKLGLLPLEVARAGGYYLCGSVPGGCTNDPLQAFVQAWSGRSASGTLRTADEEADEIREVFAMHPHRRASQPDVLLCTNLAVFCWLLRRRGVSSSKMTMPALHVFGMAFLADVPNSWRSDMLADFYAWWSSPGPDVFAACQEVLSLQMWWQMGVKVPFVPLAGISSRVGAAYDPPQEEPSLLVLRSVFWHLPAGQVFAALLERFATSASPHVHLTWLGRYTHTISMRQVGPQESKQWRSFDSMGKHTCALDVPAEISQMKVRDVMGIGLPLMSPERAWLLRLLHDMYRGWGQLHIEYGSERSPHTDAHVSWPHAPFYDPKADPISRLSYWLQLADHFRYPSVVHFASLPEMMEKVIGEDWAKISVQTRAHHRRVMSQSEAMLRTRVMGKVPEMLHVRMMASGEEVVALSAEEFDTLAASTERSVRVLKEHLARVTGCPRFRLRVLHKGSMLQDETRLDLPVSLALVKLSFEEPEMANLEEVGHAASMDDAVTVEAFLQRPQHPDLAIERGLTCLGFAARSGQLKSAKLLLEARADLNKSDEQGVTPLHLASAEGHKKVVRWLLKNRAIVGAGTTQGDTSLHFACDMGQRKIVRILLEARADSQQQESRDGATPLHCACLSGQVKVVELLLSASADVHKQTQRGATPVHWACHHGHVDVARALVWSRADVNHASATGATPLYCACDLGHVEMARFLIQADADIHRDTTNGMTPLFVSSMLGHTEIVRALVKAGADAKKATAGQIPLHIACINGHVDIVRILLNGQIRQPAPAPALALHSDTSLLKALHLSCAFGHVDVVMLLIGTVNVDGLDKHGMALLHHACALGRAEVVRCCLRAGAGVDVQTSGGTTPLQVACVAGSVRIAELLIQHGARTDLPDRLGMTPLLVSCHTRQVELAKLLLDNGAATDRPAMDGVLPLHVASIHGHEELAHLLIHKKADLDASTEDGQTALCIARFHGHWGVVRLLMQAGAVETRQPKRRRRIKGP
ncbi:ANK1 [Symbiodinium sp. CCMP2592]|nr:ANK1 [Symbiodinium sp. CCMP2592]